MTILLETIHDLTTRVIEQRLDLDGALRELEAWIDQHAPLLTLEQRDAFSAALDTKSTDDDHSLVDSVLKLHSTRLLYRHDVTLHEATQQIAPLPENEYQEARGRFARALRRSEEGVNDARIDIAIANAHHLLDDTHGNRRWLDSALSVLPDLANVDLVALAEKVPPMPPPEVSGWKRFGLKLIGFPFDRFAESNRENLIAIAGMQMNQIVLLAHLIGTSLEAIRERQRAQRAFRIAAHLIVRYAGMPQQMPDQLLDIAEDLQRTEQEAAHILARQALDLCDDLTPAAERPQVRARAHAVLHA